jgi:hypothetical protein
VPNSDWHCHGCLERIRKRDDRFTENIDDFRSVDVEDALLDQYVHRHELEGDGIEVHNDVFYLCLACIGLIVTVSYFVTVLLLLFEGTRYMLPDGDWTRER